MAHPRGPHSEKGVSSSRPQKHNPQQPQALIKRRIPPSPSKTPIPSGRSPQKRQRPNRHWNIQITPPIHAAAANAPTTAKDRSTQGTKLSSLPPSPSLFPLSQHQLAKNFNHSPPPPDHHHHHHHRRAGELLPPPPSQSNQIQLYLTEISGDDNSRRRRRRLRRQQRLRRRRRRGAAMGDWRRLRRLLWGRDAPSLSLYIYRDM